MIPTSSSPILEDNYEWEINMFNFFKKLLGIQTLYLDERVTYLLEKLINKGLVSSEQKLLERLAKRESEINKTN